MLLSRKTPYLLCAFLILISLLAACAPASTETPSTTPVIKPAPAEALTDIVGLSLSQLPGAVAVALVFGAVAAALLFFVRNLVAKNEGVTADFKSKGIITATAVFLLATTASMFWQAVPGIWVTVPADRRGVLLNFGAAAPNTVLEPGLHTLTPWRQQVALISIREFTYITTSHVAEASEDFPDFPVGARTCDGVEVQIPYTIKFRVRGDSEYLPRFYENYGSVVAAMERVVKAESRQVVREIPTGYSSISLYASSAIFENPDEIIDPELRLLVESVPCGLAATGFESLNEEIRLKLADSFTALGLELTFFGVRQPDLGAFGVKLDEIRIAAQDVRIAAQNALKAEQDRKTTETNATANANAEQIRVETAAEAQANSDVIRANADAQTRIINANAQAEANITLATSEAQATRLRASAEADANTQVARSLTTDLVTYRTTLALYDAWNGEPPYYSGTGAVVPFLQLPQQPAVETGTTQPE